MCGDTACSGAADGRAANIPSRTGNTDIARADNANSIAGGSNCEGDSSTANGADNDFMAGIDISNLSCGLA